MTLHVVLEHVLVLAAEEKPSGEGLSTVVITAVGAAIAALFAALSPALVELIKSRTKAATPAPASETKQTPEPSGAVQSAMAGASMIEAALEDLREQRDDFAQRYYDALDELDDVREDLRQRDIRIAILERPHRPQQNRDLYR